MEAAAQAAFASGVGLVYLDCAGRARWCNRAAAQLLGIASVDELAAYANPLAPFTATDAAIAAKDVVASVVQARVPVSACLLTRRTPDGTDIWVEVSGKPVSGDDGQCEGAVLTLVDAGDRVRAGRALEQRQGVLEATLEATTEGILMFGPDHSVVASNRAAQRILGLDVAQIADPSLRPDWWKPVSEDGTPYDASLSPSRQVYATGQAQYGTVLCITKPGGERTIVRVNAQPVFAGDAVVSVVSTLTDVTKERQTTEQLRSVIEAMHDGLVVQGRNGEIVSCNPAAERILGVSTDQMTGRTSMDPRWAATREDGTPCPGDAHPAMVALRTGQPQRGVIMSVTRPTGERSLLSVNAEPIWSGGTEPTAVVGTFVDITQYRDAELRMRSLLDRVSDLYNNAPCGYHSIGPDGRFLEINDTELEWLGVTREEALGGLGIVDFLTPESLKTFERLFPRFAAGQIAEHEIEFELAGRGDRRRHVLMRASAQRAEDGSLLRSRSVMMDITELVKARSEIARHLHDQHVLLENNFVGIARVRESKFVWVNAAMTRILGYAAGELIGQPTRIIAPDGAAHDLLIDALCAQLEDHDVARGQFELRHRQGHCVYVDMHAALFHEDEIVCFLTDQTMLREAQRLIAQAQRLDSMGRLTGGIAHEFNNLLQTIGGMAELARYSVGEDTALARDLQVIEQSALRGADLVALLMTYARKQMVSPVDLVLDDVIGQTVRLLRRTLPFRVAVRFEADSGRSVVHIDRSSLVQAMSNLLQNAADAIVDGGTVTVRTGMRTVTAHDVNESLDARAGEFCTVSVTDTGAGMPPEVVSQAVEPFFTTKPFGQNYGLGLSSVYGITTQAGGWMSITSQVGLGTTVTLYLPLADHQTDAHQDLKTAGTHTS